MDASTQVAPMPVLHSVMMLKVSEASRATSVTRAAAAAAAATSRRNSLSLQHALLHVQPVESALAAAVAAPMTPHAVVSATKPSASSPRDPSTKVATASPPLFAAKQQQQHGFAVSPLKLHPTIQTLATTPASPASSSDDSDELSSSESSSSPAASSKRSRDSVALSVMSPTSSTTDDASLSLSSPRGSTKANTGRWTDAEHKLFLKGLETFPYRAWKKIATLIKTRTVVQIRTHAQKYYQKLEKEEAKMKDREHSLGFHKDAASLSTASLTADFDDDLLDATSSLPKTSSSPAKKKSLLRKRKFTLDDSDVSTDSMEPLPSLPKRMLKEKKLFLREKHMSPKQKAPVSSTTKFFGFGSPEFAATAAAPESAHRAVFGSSRAAAAAMSKIPPLAFDDGVDATTDSLILDFSDDKSIGEYAFDLVDSGGMDASMSSIDNDDLLQLTDEESLDWFSTSSSSTTESVYEDETTSNDSADELLKAAATAAAEPMELVDVDAAALESSPLTLGRYHFSPLYTDECLQFSDASTSASSSSSSSSTASLQPSESSTMLSGACGAEDFLLTGDDDDDFVLDPEKFLSSYFSPSTN